MNTKTLSKSQIEKLGNTLIFLSNGVGKFGRTKALKIIFLLEENSLKSFGIPFFGFNFKLWQFGPVEESVYNELCNEDGLNQLKNYIKKVPYGDSFLLEPIKEFNDDEFSQNDLDLLKSMVKFSKHKTAKDFVRYTHGKESLWRNTALQNGLLEKLEKREISKTDIDIDFYPLFKKDEFLKERYQDFLEFQKFNNYINS